MEITAQGLLWLFVINLGVAFGAGLYEDRIVLPNWLSRADQGGGLQWNAAVAQRDNTGMRFWSFVTTMPLTLLTLVNLYLAWNFGGPLGEWWFAAAMLALTDRLFTFSYFIPSMVRLMRSPDSPEARAAAIRWRTLNYLRHLIVLAAWLAALRALSLL